MKTKFLKTAFFVLLIAGATVASLANDGAFYANGAHLFPITDSDISVKKEILKITRLPGIDSFGDEHVQIDVYYEYYNDSAAKDIIVGFEAYAPHGDANGWHKNGEQRYISNFTVRLNQLKLPYDVTIIKNDYFVYNGRIVGDTVPKSYDEGRDLWAHGQYMDFKYIYFFTAHFKKGLNVLKHSYTMPISGHVSNRMDIDYILTAANRWANRQIDDFTLILDLKDTLPFRIQKTFFESGDDWECFGRTEEVGRTFPEEKRSIEFYTNGKPLVFRAKNFHPKGELKISQWTHTIPMDKFRFDYEKDTVIEWSAMRDKYFEATDAFSYRVIRNLPFALKGYDFKNKAIKEFYLKQNWYKVDYSYVATHESLDDLGKMWLEEMDFINEQWLIKP